MASKAGRRTKTLSAYSVHGRHPDGLVDYTNFFDRLLRSPDLVNQRFTIGGEMMTVTAAFPDEEAGAGALRFVLGSETDPPLVFDPVTGEEHPIDSGRGIIVNGVWSFVNGRTRTFVIESKRPGVPAAAIATYLDRVAPALGLSPAHFELNPTASSGFANEVKKFSAIKRASISLVQPNLDWGDTEADIHEYAEKSGANRVTIEMAAPRNDELSMTRGIVRDVLSLANRPITSLQNVSITGIAPGDDAEKTVNLKRFQKKIKVNVPVGVQPRDELGLILDGAKRLANEAHAEPDDE